MVKLWVDKIILISRQDCMLSNLQEILDLQQELFVSYYV